MMLDFFGLRDMPFTREIEAQLCFPSNAHQEARARLEFAAEHRHVCMITGEAGMGKTLVVRSLLHCLDSSRYRYEYICDSGLSPRLFYHEVLERFGVTAVRSTEVKRQYQALMLGLYEQDKKIPVVVLDEAHRFSEMMLQELRFLLNFKADSMAPLALILVGQTSLRAILKVRHMEAIDQRIQVRYQMNPMTEPEMRQYIEHQTKVAGGGKELFSEEAMRAVYAYSLGVPRRVNSLCSQAMLDAYIQKNQIVSEAHVQRAVNEL
jgi:type II secretory pathway predicted ATPase ExeA